MSTAAKEGAPEEGPAPERPWPQRIAASTRGMVATANHHATAAAAEVLARGGNAVDGAVAAAFALGVCEPAASGLGGQTMMLLHVGSTRRTIALDGSSRAPHRVPPGEYSKRDLLTGHRATTVPSTPAVLSYAIERYGNLKLAQVLEPAIRLAEDGFPVSELLHRLTAREQKSLAKGSAGAVFLDEKKRPHPVGATLRQPALAGTLRALASRGVKTFYRGRIARAIAEDMKAHDGLIHRDDLAQIPWPLERRPMSFKFGSWRGLTFPEPGAGRTLIEMFRILENLPERRRRLDTPEGICVLAEVIRRAALDRRDRPHDPNFAWQFDERRTTSPDYAKLVARQVNKRITGHGETTHLSAMDAEGNTVALTQSIERVYGSFEMCPELGFLYNNYMSAFEYEDISHPYYLRPAAVPWASVAPTIVMRGRRPWVAIGSPGSERIVSAILQVLLRLATQPALDAVTAPRLHCSIGGKVSLEASRMRDDVPAALRRRGFEVDEREPFSFYLGCVQLVLRDGKHLVGVADPRRDGSASGPAS